MSDDQECFSTESDTDRIQTEVTKCNSEDELLRWWHLSSWIKWTPTSLMALANAEKALLAHIWDKLNHRFVKIMNGAYRIRTISINENVKDKIPLVLIHGFGSGVGLWSQNLEQLSKKRTVYAFDVLGFGMSSRPHFKKKADAAEQQFVESIEEWRKEMNIEQFVLLGHSFGGFLCGAYSVKYPERVKHLILCDPWGFPAKPTDPDKGENVPVWLKLVAAALSPFNPLTVIRAAGPWGPSLIERFRGDLTAKFVNLYGSTSLVTDYIYHCNAQKPSGEAGFRHVSIPFGWARNPMGSRLVCLSNDFPITFIYGSKSWIDNGIAYEVKYARKDAFVEIINMKGCGHHVYADNPPMFNHLVNKVCDSADNASHNTVNESSTSGVSTADIHESPPGVATADIHNSPGPSSQS